MNKMAHDRFNLGTLFCQTLYRILPLVLALLISFVWMAESAFAAKLREVRTGEKSGFTRLVFQFETPARFQVQDKAALNQLSILFLDTTSGLSQANQKYAEPVKNIAINPDGPHLKAVVGLSIPHYRLKTFVLTEPHRVVFDLYPAAAAESFVKLNKLVVKESAEAGSTPIAPSPLPAKEPEPPAKKPEPEPPVVADSQPPVSVRTPAVREPEQELKAPEPAPPVEKESEKSLQPTSTPEQPSTQPMVKKDFSANKPRPSALGAFQRNMVIVLAGISIVILALIGLLLMQRKSNAEKSRPVEPVEELKTTADIMATIDARIKEKFKQYEEADDT